MGMRINGENFISNYCSLEILKYVSVNLNKVSYEEIYKFIFNSFQYIPVPIAKIAKNSKVDRVRPNTKNKLFRNIQELSYIKDTSKIKTFGRANKLGQAMFYGCLTGEIEINRLTALSETCDYIFDDDIVDFKGKHFTLSRWNVEKDLLVVEIVFSDEAIANNRYVKNNYQKQLEFLKEQNLTEEYFHIEFMRFISNEFAKKINNDYEYMISVAFTNVVMNKQKNVAGIAYPSVKTEFKGSNVVLFPNKVDDSLSFEICNTIVVYKNKKKVVVPFGKYKSKSVNDLGNIHWSNMDKKLLTRKYIIMRQLIDYNNH